MDKSTGAWNDRYRTEDGFARPFTELVRGPEARELQLAQEDQANADQGAKDRRQDQDAVLARRDGPTRHSLGQEATIGPLQANLDIGFLQALKEAFVEQFR